MRAAVCPSYSSLVRYFIMWQSCTWKKTSNCVSVFIIFDILIKYNITLNFAIHTSSPVIHYLIKKLQPSKVWISFYKTKQLNLFCTYSVNSVLLSLSVEIKHAPNCQSSGSMVTLRRLIQMFYFSPGTDSSCVSCKEKKCLNATKVTQQMGTEVCVWPWIWY